MFTKNFHGSEAGRASEKNFKEIVWKFYKKLPASQSWVVKAKIFRNDYFDLLISILAF